MKKTLFLFLTSILPMMASAYDAEIDGIYYNFNQTAKTAEVTNGGSESYSGAVNIPATVSFNGDTYSVTSIGDCTFQDCLSLTSVTIGNSVTSIGGYAFYRCGGLTSVTIPSSVTSIGEDAFSGCSGLTSVTIPNSVTNIGYGAFDGTGWYNKQPDGLVYAGKVAYKYKGTMPEGTNIVLAEGTLGIAGEAFSVYGCSGLTSVTIPNSVTSIGNGAFLYCSGLASVTIPNSVTSIGNGAFSGCSGLESIKVESGNTVYDSRNDCNAIIKTETNELISGCKNTIIPNGVTSIGDAAFDYCVYLTSVTIPNSVTSIGDYAFQDCWGLTSVTIPNSVTSIGDLAFEGCGGLTSVTIPNSVTSIGDLAFEGCGGLTSVTIGNSVTSIGRRAFDGTGWYNNQPDGLVYAGKVAYKYKGTMPEGTNIVLAEGTLGIADNAFSGCSGLTSVTIPNSVTSIGAYAFYGCRGLTSVTIPNSVTNIGYGAFDGTGWYNNQPDGLVYAGKVAYKYKGTMPEGTNIVLAEGTLGIADNAFLGCSGLTSVTIPNSVTWIGERAFSGCSGLTSVKTYAETPPSLGERVFYRANSLCQLLVPFCSKAAYKAASGWKDFQEIREFYPAGTVFSAVPPQGIGMQFRVLDEEALTVETYAYQDGEEYVTAIDQATEGDLIIPAEINSNGLAYRVAGIGSNSFRECMGITSASLPAGIQYIGEGAFRLATNLKAVNIPEGVEALGAHTFNGCPLTTVVLPSTLKRIIGTYVFRYGNIKNENAACSFIANMKRPCTLDEGSIYGMEYYDLYVPKGRKEFYLSEPLWENFRSVREIGEVDDDVKDKITAKGVTLKAGENATLIVSLTTEGSDYNGYQFNLYLPEGVSVATDENGNYLIREKTGRKKVILPVDDGSVLFYTTADKNHAVLANGPLMEIELTADSALAAGKYTVRIERVVCATRENKSVSLPSSTATVTVEKAAEETPAVVTADDVEGEPAKQIKLPIFLNNTTDINAFYFDLTLPMGVTVAKDNEGQFVASFVGDYADGQMLLSCQPWDASMGTTNNVNTWRFIATPKGDDVFRANAGRVMNITLDVDKDMAGGVYTARMNVVKLIEVGAVSSRADSGQCFQVLRSPAVASWTSYSSITIKTAMQGDVNGDNVVDVADIATVISVMASGTGNTNPLQQAADVNGDGVVDVADIAAIIDTMAANTRRVNNR